MTAPDNLQNLFDTLNPSYFRKQSEETRAKIGAASKGRVMPPTHSEKVRKANLGRAVSAETRAKLRKANLGRAVSAETRAKTSATLKGHKKPANFGHKVSAGKTRSIMTPVGLFESRKLFADWLYAQGVRDVDCKIGKWLKTHSDQVYYVVKKQQQLG